MNAKAFMEGICANYPESLHPTEQAQVDMIRTLKALRYDSKQLQNLYDEILRNCEFFPRVADIVANASKLNLPFNQTKGPETHFATWTDDQGRPWARRDGVRAYETMQQRDERYQREAIPTAEGLALFHEAFAMAAEGNKRSIYPPKAKETGELSFDFGDEYKHREVIVGSGVEFEFVDDISGWEDL